MGAKASARHWRVGAVVAAVLLVAVGSFVAIERQGPADPSGGSANAEAAAGALGKAGAGPRHDDPIEARGCHLEAGQELAYSIELEGTAEVDPRRLGHAAASAQVFSQRKTMELDLRVLQAGTSGAGSVVLAHFRQVQGGQTLPQVDTPFLLQIDEDCSIAAYARHKTMLRAHARTQQAIAHELLFVSPQNRGAVAGRQLENARGRYRAHFEAAERDHGTSVRGTVVSYVAYWDEAHDGTKRLDRVPRTSDLDVTLGDGPWFERLRALEELDGEHNRARASVVATRKDVPAGAFDGLPEAQDSYEWENLLPELLHLRVPRLVTAAELEARERVAHLTARQSVDAFTTRVQQGVPFHEQWPELTVYLEARPDQTGAVMDLLRQGDISQTAAPALYVAMGRARTPEALRELHGIMQDPTAPPPERVRAAFAMVDRDDVGAGLARDLAGYASDVAGGSSKAERIFAREAVLALGALSGLHEEEEEIRQVSRRAAAEVLESSDDPKVVRPAFGALANMGDPSTLPVAEKASHHPDPGFREAAAIVVRRMHPDDTSGFVADWLAREPDLNVKRALYSVVARQTSDIRVPVSRALVQQGIRDLAQQPGNITRKAIVHVLGRSVQAYPEARQALLEQVPIELKKKGAGMYGVIARYLEPDQLREAVTHAL